MITTYQFASAVGRKKMAEALDVGATAVSNAVVRGRFPSSWFTRCQTLAIDAGVDCPPDLFGMRAADDTPKVDKCKENQRGAA